MELVKANNTITSVVPKIVETPWHFIINTQLYDKLTFRPYPMKFFALNYGHYLSLNCSIQRTAFKYSLSGQNLESTTSFEHNPTNIIQDKFNSNIFYAIREYYLSGFENHIIEKVSYNRETNEYTILNSITVSLLSDVSSHKNNITMLYENDEKFVFFINGRESSSASMAGYKGGLVILDKSNLSVSTIPNALDNYYYTLTNVEDSVYLYRLGYITNSINEIIISKLNVNNKQLTPIRKIVNVSMNNRSICNPVKIGDNYYVLISDMKDNKYYYRMLKFALDTTIDEVTTEIFDIDLNGFVLDESGNLTYRNSMHHTMRIIEEDGNTYISLLLHATPNTTSPEIYKQCKHVLLKYDNDTFTIIDSVNFEGCFGSFEYNDTKHQIFYTPTSVQFFVFDSAREKMVKSFEKGGVYLQVGMDSLNRIILYGTDDRLEMITEGNSSILKAYFEEEFYDKGHENIESKVTFYSKNFLDEYINSSVKLTLVGPVEFTENNSKELTTTTSQGLKSVPVTITGYGNIEVIITQNT